MEEASGLGRYGGSSDRERETWIVTNAQNPNGLLQK